MKIKPAVGFLALSVAAMLAFASLCPSCLADGPEQEKKRIDPGYNILTDYCQPEVIQKVRVYLRDVLGYNDAVTSGFLTNMVAESKLDPDTYGDHLASYGICQWNDDRLENLEDYAEEMGGEVSDMYLQLMFLDYEMTTSYNELDEYLRELPNSDWGAECAAGVLCKQYEVPVDMDKELEERKYNAVWDFVYGTSDGE